MKQLLLFVLTVITLTVSAQKKEIPMDVNYNQYLSHQGFGYMYHEDGSLENFVVFQNYTNDYLEVHMRVPQIGVDTVYIVSPNAYSEVHHLGWNLISSRYEDLRQLNVECTVNQPDYDFTLKFIWARKINGTTKGKGLQNR